eukprot:3375079-Karenia_brevis.AAC.1
MAMRASGALWMPTLQEALEALSDLDVLKRCGFPNEVIYNLWGVEWENCAIATELVERAELMVNFARELVSQHMYVMLHYSLAIPPKFAQLLSNDAAERSQCLQYLKKLDGYVKWAEVVVATQSKTIWPKLRDLLKDLYCTREILPREWMVELRKTDWKVTQYVFDMLYTHFSGGWHTKLTMEDLFSMLKDVARGAKHSQLNPHRLFWEVANAKRLCNFKHFKHIVTTEEDWSKTLDISSGNVKDGIYNAKDHVVSSKAIDLSLVSKKANKSNDHVRDWRPAGPAAMRRE